MGGGFWNRPHTTGPKAISSGRTFPGDCLNVSRNGTGAWETAFLSIPMMVEEEKLDHSTHERLASTELTESNLVDATVYGPDDEKVGSVSHLHGTGADAQVIVDVGGFLGIGAKPVALPASQLDFMRDENGRVHATTSITKEQVKALPEHHH